MKQRLGYNYNSYKGESILWFLIYNILRLIFGLVSKVIGKGWWKLNWKDKNIFGCRKRVNFILKQNHKIYKKLTIYVGKERMKNISWWVKWWLGNEWTMHCPNTRLVQSTTGKKLNLLNILVGDSSHGYEYWRTHNIPYICHFFGW